ncbi:MAG: DNA-binding response regulator [Planctomycetota bacterium]|nr:MAG: DNA-binding response regulator [Planctomycetota bacterium]
MDGLDAIPQLRASAPDAKIIILTQSDQEADVLKAISLGASGYLLKSATLEQLAESIRTVHSGGASLEGSVAKYILARMQSALAPGGGQQLLSDRECEVLSLIAEGKVKKEIAAQLGISYTTVDTHVSRIYLKLNATNAPAAVNKAHQLQILPTDSDTND